MTLSTKDEKVVDSGIAYGIRAVQPEAIGWGANASLWQFGFLRWYRTLIFKWYEKRFVKHLRCQWSFSHDYGLPVNRLIEVIEHALERGWTVTLVVFNFTSEALSVLSDDQVSKLKTYAGGNLMAGKFALTAGWRSGDEKILQFSREWLESRLSLLERFKDRIEIELENEVNLFWKTRPSTFTPFSTSIGMTPQNAEGQAISELGNIVKKAGFNLYEPKAVHAYTNWTGSRKDAFYLGFEENLESWDGNEWGAHPTMPNLAYGIYQSAFDIARRLPRRMYYHTYSWCFGETIKQANTPKIYDPFRSVEAARSWGTPTDYEAVAVCFPEADRALTVLGEAFSFG